MWQNEAEGLFLIIEARARGWLVVPADRKARLQRTEFIMLIIMKTLVLSS